MEKWYESAVFYHMYPLGMLGAPKANEQEEVTHRLPKLHRWVDHLKELEVTAVYIGPLFESSTHGYDTRDYKLVDRRLGDNEDFKEFVAYCHKAGIKVVVDGVFNHTGREFWAFTDIQKNRKARNTAAGIRSCIFMEIRIIMTDSGIRHGGTALSWQI